VGEGARPAAEADAARLAELRLQAREELGAERGASVFLHREMASPAADRPGRRTWVGLYDDAILGYLTAWVEELAGGERLGRIEEVYVEPGARAVGVGEAIIDEALTWFREEGCSGADAYALPGMRDTKNFFEMFGFTARLLVVHRPLTGPDR
jgi:GNAT superfamily N-acetyltransferase